MSTSSDRSKPKRSERICFRGDPITSIEDVVAAWLRSQWFIIHIPTMSNTFPAHDKSMHPEMVVNMKMRTVLELVTSGKLFHGVTDIGEPYKSIPGCRHRHRDRRGTGSLPLHPIKRTVLAFEDEEFELHPSGGTR